MKLKTNIIIFAVLLAFCGPLQAQTKVGTVDLKKLFDGYWKTRQADAGLKDEASDAEKKRKDMVDDYQKLNDAYKKLIDSAGDQAVSNEERDKRKKAAEAKLIEIKEAEQTINQYERSVRAKFGDKQRSLRDKLLKEIRDAVEAKSKSHGFTMVFDTAAESVNGTPVMLYFTTENDITQEVLDYLNMSAPADLPKGDSNGKKGDDTKKDK